MLVRDIMSPAFPLYSLSTPILQVATRMTQGCHPAALVVDEKGTLVGLITDRDLVALTIPAYLDSLDDLSFIPGSVPFPLEGSRDLDTTRVGDIIVDREVHVLTEDDPVVEAAHWLVQEPITCCPVVRDGKPVGLVTRHDLLRVMLESSHPEAAE